jgi:HAD superfamily hydrolase (TIGR01549 family)
MNETTPKIIIFDLDGTLYNHSLLRVINILNLSINLMQQKLNISDLHIIASLRKLQENSSTKEATIQSVFESLASRFEMPVSEVKAIRNRWMVDNQKWALVISKRRWLARRISKLRNHGILVAVWSDNPVDKKLEFLRYHTDFSLTSEDQEIDIGKPSPKGLLKILTYFNLSSSEAILIGDRIDRDGQAAQRAGVRFELIGLKSRILLFNLNKELGGK